MSIVLIQPSCRRSSRLHEGQFPGTGVAVVTRGSFPTRAAPSENDTTRLALAHSRAAEKWQELKGEAAPSGYAKVRVHDLKHRFGHRLEGAGTTFGDCQVLLGHRPRTVTQRYMVPEIVRLDEAAEPRS